MNWNAYCRCGHDGGAHATSYGCVSCDCEEFVSPLPCSCGAERCTGLVGHGEGAVRVANGSWREYITEVQSRMLLHPHWRKGQTYFNVLHERRPEIANRIRNTAVDAYYDDKRMFMFLEEAKRLWSV